MRSYFGDLTVIGCTFNGNSAVGDGGGMFNYLTSSLTLTNNMFIGNSAADGGGMYNLSTFGDQTITNCTFSGNSAGYGGGIYNEDTLNNVTLTNCILWGNIAALDGNEIALEENSSIIEISYCDIKGGEADIFVITSTVNWGSGNIDANPLIWDTRGHLLSNSPCRNAGDPAFAPDPNYPWDIDGDDRVIEDFVDMGVDELLPPIENITSEATFSTLQAAINDAGNRDTIVVQPGTYTGSGNRDIDFGGKAITLRSSDPDDPNVVAVTIIDCLNNGRGFIFNNSEDPNSVLDGFTITNGFVADGDGGGILCDSSSPTIQHCVIAGNTAGSGGANISGDDRVDIEDFTILASQWLDSPGIPSADIVPTGVVDEFDLAVIAEYWLWTSCD